DLQSLKMTRKEFESRYLKESRMTLYEWKEDVIRPRLVMTKLCQGRVQVADEDIVKAYQAMYGAKVECQIIIWSKDQKEYALSVYPNIRSSPEDFDREARRQYAPNLAAAGGRIAPIARYSTDNQEMEEVAFALQPGEVSKPIEGKEGLMVIKCLRHIPPQNKKLEEVRAALEKDAFDKKLEVEIKQVFPELKKQARPVALLGNESGSRGATPELQLASAGTEPAMSVVQAGAPGSSAADYSQRVVAYIHGNVPITREML